MKKGIVLIGMPGAGKTTIGRYISEKLNFKFVDMDEFIERSSKKSIKEIFNQGEDLFRAFETKTCEVLSRFDNVVISTGGGVVKKEENMAYYKDFVVVFINRPLELILDDIDVDSRPLLKDGKERVINLYRERIDLYNKYLDIEVINDGSIEDVAKDIILKTKEYLA
ncbi:shikimate kinase [Clostridium mediterraneense]|uniref:shikimate kinase n=1 Tax=Clostridium mediterraneense TaxID=1805472 RepID=UPI00082EA34A|nr:shikimate kinase [Clostridium mediterraneense]